ncbi:sugar transferase [Pontibacter toksunensis]|uniref:Sugar transferase n=1 Tax=Pontibacter toksunensis TaxID=1332631 RepID=A0ABW6BLR6_9BACT
MNITATTQTKQTNLVKPALLQKLLLFLFSNKKSFAFEVTDRKYLLFTVDLLLILLATFIYSRSFISHLTLAEAFQQYWPWFIAVTVYWSFFSYVFDLYNLEKVNKFYTIVKNILIASTLTVGCYLLLPWYTPALPDSRLFIFLFYINTVLSLITWRYVYTRLLIRPLFLKRVIIVGSGWPSQALIDVFANGDIFNYHLGYKVVGLLDETVTGSSYKGVRILQKIHDLPRLMKRLKVDEIIVSDSLNDESSNRFLLELTKCRMKGIDVTSLSDFYEELTGRVLVHNSGRDFYLSFPYNNKHFKNAYQVFNRATDLVFGICGVMACLFFLPLIYLANMLFSKGPLFYSQERVGLYGKTFKITKFRSMVIDAEKDGAAWAQKNDCRITPIGKILRRSRIDELPQAWSVLKGDMSLIGPRPERPVFVEQLKQEIPFYDTRHLAKPGITGWAQAIYKYGSNTDDALMKVQYDLYYLKNRSFLLDIKVILKTISVVLRFKGM